MLIRGRCHCGNISFDLDWDPAPERIPARACGIDPSPAAFDGEATEARLARRARNWIADVRFETPVGRSPT